MSLCACKPMSWLAVLGIAVRNAILDLGSFLIVVPSSDHQERHVIRPVVVLMEELECVFKGPPAPPIHMAVQAPRCLAVVKTWPDSAYGDLVGVLVFHFLVKALEILFSPLAAVRRPAFRTGMNPCIFAVKHLSVLFGRLVLVDQQWRLVPCIHGLTDSVPIRVSPLREDEDHWAIAIEHIGIAGRSRGTNIVPVGLVHRFQGIIRRMTVILFRR